ncbi:hypothetical protein [Carboxylicivirga linearis]|uniref:Pentraxin (PTX) domain-containing protein n=1 Tax=Carboxylicivirga linearis TaxID=1628157 RepID=A0ABS5JTC2_9BACT|nr:hypothetical protein [Carboxylicivirga linearis]MBS2098130.1 hypothetical protein [Carboxylicivirga linearis]
MAGFNLSKQINYLFFIGISFLLPVQIIGQTGPGSIGNTTGTNGNPKIVLWLDGESLELSENDNISTWLDQSGNNNDLSQTDPTLTPIYRAGVLNGKAIAEFSQSNNRIRGLNFDMPADEISTFIVTRTASSGEALISYAVSSQDNEYLVHDASSLTSIIQGSSWDSNETFNDDNWHIITQTWASSDGGTYLYKDNNTALSSTTANGSITSLGCFAIGGEQDNVDGGYQTNQAFEGDIAEIIVFDRRLSQAEVSIVNNYLNLKYAASDGDFPIAKDGFNNVNAANHINNFGGTGVESDGASQLYSLLGIELPAGNLSAGDYLMTAHNGIENNLLNIETGLTNADGAWGRSWYIQRTGTFDPQITFDLSEFEDGKYFSGTNNYVLLYKSTEGGTYTVMPTVASLSSVTKLTFTVNNADWSDGFYTLGSTDLTIAPLQGVAGVTYYAWLNDDWDNPDTWSIQENTHVPNGYTPTTSPTSDIDKVIIKNGITVNVNSNSKSNALLGIRGTLDLGSTSGHNWSTINGSGRLVLESDEFPVGDATRFITKGLDEGTVVYEGAGFTYLTEREFFNLEVNLNSSTNGITLLNNLKVNGNCYINRGILKINDDASTTGIDIGIDGNLWIQSNGSISTGIGNARHELNLMGDFTNNGVAYFTNRTSQIANSEATDGIVDVNLLNKSSDQVIQLNGITNFYRIEIDKGIDQTYVASIDADDAAYFNLFGYANESHDGDQPYRSSNNNALGLIAGTFKLGANINVLTLSNNRNFDIPERARLWVDGATVLNNNGNATVPYGTLQVSGGLFESKVSSGITTRKNGLIKIEGGIVNTNVIRTSVRGADNVGGYVQSGGTMNLISGSMNSDYYRFCMTYPGNVFNMSGGTLNIQQSGGLGGIFINSDAQNINVTGGTVICNVSSNSDFNITSKAPFYNLQLTNSAGNTYNHVLADASNVAGTETVSAQPLVVLNDLSIETDAFLHHNGQDITVGGNFSIAADAQIQSENGTNNYGLWFRNRESAYNTLTFNGNNDAEFYIGHNVDDGYELYLSSVVINKPEGKSLTLKGDPNKEASNVSHDYYARLFRVFNNMTVESGIFNQGEHAIRLYGPLNVKSGAQCGVYEHGTTHIDALIMFKDADIEINTESGAVLGNIKMNPAPDTEIISLTSDVTIKRISYYHGRINMGPYNLKLDYLHRGGTTNPYRVSDGNAATEMFYGDGNASDGGLTRYIEDGLADNTDVVFPIGVPGKYTPVSINLANVPVGGGYITVVPVDGELQTTDVQNGGNMLSYYWKLDNSDFSDMPDAKFLFYYDEDDVTSQENLYVPGKVLSVDPYSRLYIDDTGRVDDNINEITYDDGSGGRFPLDIANYTAGRENRFTGSVSIFYTRDHGSSTGGAAREPRWRDRYTWTRNDLLQDLDGNGTIDDYEYHDSRQPECPNGNNDYPEAGDVAVIGWVPWTDTQKTSLQGQPHGVWIDNTQDQVAELVFTQMKDAGGNPTERVYRSAFQFRPTLCINGGSGQLTAGLVRGEGLFWNRYSDPDFTLMDLGEFVANDSSYIAYENSVNPRTINNIPDEVPNLMLANSGWGASDYDITIEKDLMVNGSLEILGNANLLLHDGATGDITIGDNLLLFESNPSEGSPSGGGAQLLYPNNAVRTVTVGKDIIMANASSLLAIDNPSSNGIEHTLNVYGDIYQASSGVGSNGIQLWTAANEDKIVLNLLGNSSMTYSYVNGDIPNLYRLIVDKGTSQDVEATFNTDFNLHGPTSGVGIEKALELSNGMFIVNNADVNLDLTTGDDDFYIPSTAGLRLLQGAAYANGNSNIILDGTMDVNSGLLDMSGGNNNIEYSASGNAVLAIGAGGSLIVGGQVRGSLTADEGILKYRQTGGSVILGENSATEGGRGILEVHNTGSEFTFTAGTLQFVRQQSSPIRASLYLQPDESTIGSDVTIQFGNASTPASQNMGIHSSIALENIVVDNSSSNNPTVTTWVENLDLNGDLIIGANSVFDCNDLDISIGGDLQNNGLFDAGSNITTFTGDVDQSITGSSAVTFNNLSKLGNGQLDLNGDILVSGEFNLSGTVIDNDHTIELKGNFINNGMHNYGGVGSGIIMSGSTLQSLSGNGTLGLLRVNNNSGVKVADGYSVNVENGLQLEDGVFDIGGNLLTLNKDAVISPVNPFGETNMIQTTKSYVDAGVKQLFGSFSGPGTKDLIFPMGSNGVFTPIEMSINSVTSTIGSITVKASHEVHPTIIEDDESPDVEIVDDENALQFYWILRSDEITNFDATVRFYANDDLALSNSPSYDQSDYITARLLNDGTYKWTKYGQDTYDEANDVLTFTYSGTNDLGISGDYTAGVEPQTATKKGAIPDEVPVYTTIADGNWSDAIWSPIAPAGGPRGARVEINHDVTMASNFVSAYTTTINSSGRLSLGATYGHRLGDVFGTGVLHIYDGAMPSASYNEFITSSGGTFDFDGTQDYSVLSNFVEVNNVVFTGTGERDLPNGNLTIHGNLIIDGDNANLDLVNLYNMSYLLERDLILNMGAFSAGIDDATITFNGIEPQEVTGDFTGANGFNNLEINNVAGLTLNNSTEVNNRLILTSGVINTSDLNTLTITNPASAGVQGGSSNSFVNGPLRKRIPNNDTFDFPVGNNGRIGYVGLSGIQSGTTGIWEAEYIASNPLSGGYDPDEFTNPLNYVSHGEYWRVKGPTSAEANITVRWDGQSGVSVDEDERKNLRIVEWTAGTTDSWNNAGDNIVDGGATNGTITTTATSMFNAFANGNIFSWGSITPSAVYGWIGGAVGYETDWFTAINWSQGSVPDISSEVEISTATYQPVINGNAFALDLTINASANLTVSPGSQFTVDGDIINNGQLIIQNNNTDMMASFINNGTISGSGTEKVDFSFDSRRYWYIGSPVDGVTGADLYVSDNDKARVYRYNGSWIEMDNDLYDFDAEPLQGYSVIYRDPETITFEGRARYGDYTYSIQKGWELVANPYPAFLDVSIANEWNFSNISETIYTRTTYGGERDLATYNRTTGYGVNGGSKYIAPMQAFWVNCTNSGEFGVNKGARVHHSAVLKSNSSENNVLRMKLDNGLFEDEIAMVCLPEGSHIFSKVDSKKKFSDNANVAYLYSLKQNNKVAINVLPEPETIEKVLVGYQVSNEWQGDLILKATNLGDFDASPIVLLEDKVLGVFIDLRSNQEYKFTHVVNQSSDRFVVHFTDVATDISDTDDIYLKESSNISIYKENKHAVVKVDKALINKTTNKAVALLYSLEGVVLDEKEVLMEQTMLDLPKQTGIYIVKVQIGSNVKTAKIFVSRME